MLKRLFLLFVLLGLLSGGFVWYKQQQALQMAAMMKPPPPATVTATRVERQTWQPQLPAVGTLTAIQGIDVANEVAGLVRKIGFESGQAVKRGEILLELDDQVDQAELKGLQASLELARLRFQRASRLVKERSVSQSDFDTAEAELASARAMVASKQAAVAKKVIRAPFDGVLGLRQVSLGQFLPAGSAIVPLVQLDPVYVDFSLPERFLSDIAVDQQISLKVDALTEARIGKVVAIDPDIDTETRQIRLRAALANADYRLRPGMFARVSLDLGRQESVLTLPRTAITYAPYGDSVYLISDTDEGTTVQQRQVQTGAVIDDRVIIEQGLNESDQVVLTGQVKLRNGAQVQIDNQVVPAAEAAAQ